MTKARIPMRRPTAGERPKAEWLRGASHLIKGTLDQVSIHDTTDGIVWYNDKKLPETIGAEVGGVVGKLLAGLDLTPQAMQTCCHPGGPTVLKGIAGHLGITAPDMQVECSPLKCKPAVPCLSEAKVFGAAQKLTCPDGMYYLPAGNFISQLQTCITRPPHVPTIHAQDLWHLRLWLCVSLFLHGMQVSWDFLAQHGNTSGSSNLALLHNELSRDQDAPRQHILCLAFGPGEHAVSVRRLSSMSPVALLL